MALGPVQRHVADRVAMVDEGIEVGQGAAKAAPQRGLPGGGAAAHDGDADGGAECKLGE